MRSDAEKAQRREDPTKAESGQPAGVAAVDPKPRSLVSRGDVKNIAQVIEKHCERLFAIIDKIAEGDRGGDLAGEVEAFKERTIENIAYFDISWDSKVFRVHNDFVAIRNKNPSSVTDGEFAEFEGIAQFLAKLTEGENSEQVISGEIIEQADSASLKNFTAETAKCTILSLSPSKWNQYCEDTGRRDSSTILSDGYRYYDKKHAIYPKPPELPKRPKPPQTVRFATDEGRGEAGRAASSTPPHLAESPEKVTPPSRPRSPDRSLGNSGDEGVDIMEQIEGTKFSELDEEKFNALKGEALALYKHQRDEIIALRRQLAAMPVPSRAPTSPQAASAAPSHEMQSRGAGQG